MARKFRIFASISKGQSKWLGSALRNETTGGVLLLAAALVAIIWANIDYSSYSQIKDVKVGPSELNLELSLGKWAADGLLAIFFFVAGLELKHELTHGSLRDRSIAAVPNSSRNRWNGCAGSNLYRIQRQSTEFCWLGNSNGNRHRFCPRRTRSRWALAAY